MKQMSKLYIICQWQFYERKYYTDILCFHWLISCQFHFETSQIPVCTTVFIEKKSNWVTSISHSKTNLRENPKWVFEIRKFIIPWYIFPKINNWKLVNESEFSKTFKKCSHISVHGKPNASLDVNLIFLDNKIKPTRHNISYTIKEKST